VSVPHITTALTGDVPELERKILNAMPSIEDWLQTKWRNYATPFYASVDLRNSGFKLAPVDTNLYPGGFNNLNTTFDALCQQAVVAAVAKELGILTVAVVTRPFEMEGGKRTLVANHGLAELGKYVDSLITIPNQKLLTVLGAKTTLLDAFKSANHVLQGAVQGIAELITRPGLINVDFADVRTVMSETGMAMMGSGVARGENRAKEAAEMAVSSPLLEDINLQGAHGILVNVTAGMDLSIGEFQEVGQIVKQFASEDATVVVGTVIDPELSNQVRVTVVATGLGRPASARPLAAPQREATLTRDAHAHAHGAREAQSRAEPPMRVVRRGPLSTSDYAALDKPTVQRQRAVGDGLRQEAEPDDLLDIPAFLRRQAD